MPNDCSQLAMAAGFDPQDAKAVFGIVEGYPLDKAGDDLTIGRSIMSG